MDVVLALDEEVGMGWLVVDADVAGAVLDPGPDCEGVPPEGDDEVLPMLGQAGGMLSYQSCCVGYGDGSMDV